MTSSVSTSAASEEPVLSKKESVTSNRQQNAANSQLMNTSRDSVATAGEAASSYTAPASLRDRLEARHRKALEDFQNSIRELNDTVDERQRQRVADLKSVLLVSHNEAQETLESEASRVATHHNFLEQLGQEILSSSPGDVSPSLVDYYHTAQDLDFAAPRKRMLTERERILQLATWVRRRYQERQDAITSYVDAMESEEAERRDTIQASLRDLMIQLAQTSFCSITGSHVIAQRVIHHVNEQIAANHLVSRTLLSQLRRREVLKLGAYNKQVANLYTSLREGMAKSSLWWLRSLLQSPYYRRPTARMSAVEQISRVSCDAQREAKHYLSSLAVTLQSLRESRDTSQNERRIIQRLGGSTPAGWLRHYEEDLFVDPFPTDPSEVVDEWRMKAIVVIRNSLASIVALTDGVKADEHERVRTADALLSALSDEIDWLFTPLDSPSGEAAMLAQASLSCYELDICFQGLVESDQQRCAHFKDTGLQIIKPALSALEAECTWFYQTVETGLQSSHKIFEDSILLAYKSVMRQFEKATEALVMAVRGTFGFVRELYQKQDESKKDYEDRLSLLEEDFEIISTKLSHAASMGTAHELFAEGIQCLETISKTYTSYNKQFLQELDQMREESCAHTDQIYEFLTAKLGVESTDDTQARLKREKQAKIEAAMAKMIQEQSHGKKGSRGKKSKSGESGAASTSPSPPINAGILDADGASALTATQAQQLALIEAELAKEVPEQYPILHTLPTRDAGDGDGQFHVIHPVAFIEDIVPPVKKDELDSSISSQGKRKGKKKSSSPTSTLTSRPSTMKGKKGKKGAGNGENVESKKTPEAAIAVVQVDDQFVASYHPLFEGNIAHPECFIEQAYVDEWTETLRFEILNWLLVLRRETATGIKEYVERSANEAEVNINYLLRNHRRRPATFQADVYEARVRELENKSSQSEKYCARLMDRVAKLESTLQLLRHDPVQATEDEKTLKDLEEIEKKVEEASSKHVLQVLERRHAARQAHYVDSYASQKQRVLEAADKQRELIESDVTHYLAERERQLATEEFGDRTLEEAIERDTLSIRVRTIAERLRATMLSVQEFAEQEHQQRRDRMQSAKEKYDHLHQRSVAELQLIAFVQETFSRLKLQVQTVIQKSKSEEERVATAIRTIEETVQHPTSRPRTEQILRLLFSKDYGLIEDGNDAQMRKVSSTGLNGLSKRGDRIPPAGRGTSTTLQNSVSASAKKRRSTTTLLPPMITSSGTADVPELPDDIEDLMREEMEAKMCLVKVQYQRLLQSCPAAELLGVLDHLRELLYVRGVSLNALNWAVELIRVQPEHYIEPKIPPKESEANINASGGSSGGGGAKRRQQRSIKGAASVALTLDPLPHATVMEAQIVNWIKSAKKEVITAIEEHLRLYPAPLLRASPVLLKATDDQAIFAAVDTLSAAPHKRFSEHHRTAMVSYHEHVQRLFVALQLVPQFLTSSLLNLAGTSLTNRIQSVMDTFGAFYSRSSALQEHHQSLVKVALASQCNKEKLEHLDMVETVRQEKTRHITTWLWGCAIREVQEEVGLHAARCLQTTNTFFQLLKGLTSPEHLTPCDVDLVVGYHRGLKHLLRIREKDGKLRDMADQEGGPDGDNRTSTSGPASKGSSGKGNNSNNAKHNVPDAVPVFRFEASKDARSSSSGSGSGKDGKGDKGAPTPDPSGVIVVPVPQYAEVEYPGLPISRFRPLEQFNSKHPDAVVTPPLGARLYYPPPPTDDLPVGGASAASGSGTGKKGKRGVAKVEPVEESEILSPSIVAPATRLHQQAVLFAGEALEDLTRTSTAVVKDANSAFQSMEDREAQWVKSWLLTTNRLKRSAGPMICAAPGGPMPSSGISGSGGIVGVSGGSAAGAAAPGGGGATGTGNSNDS